MFRQIFRVRVTPLRLALAALVVAGLTLAFTSATSVAAAGRIGHTGQALALRAALKPGGSDAGVRRLVYNASLPPASRPLAARGAKAMAAGGRKALAGGNATTAVQVAERVQTYDVFAPFPAFAPTTGPLTPDNRTPVFTSDVANGDKTIVFSSNRPHTDVNGNAGVNDGTYHLWSIAANDPSGTSLSQITTSTGSEFFPALNPVNNQQLAFTSTAGNGTSNLYTIDNYVVGGTAVNVNTLRSLTIRNNDPNPPPNSNLDTGFGEVLRPTWSPDGSRIAFSALDTTGTNPGVHHIYYLYEASGGALDTAGPTSSNPPGKLTTGATDDTDPAWFPVATRDLIAYASATAPGAARSLYTITIVPNANISTGTAPTQITNTAGADDFGPAWYPAGNGQLAFARKLTTAAHYDIYTRSGFAAEPNSASIQFNTDDNAGETSLVGTTPAANPGNSYDDVYPTYSLSQTIAYASSRSVTYNGQDANGNAVAAEQAVSLGQGSTSVDGNAVGAASPPNVPGYMGILISRLNDVDPPKLLPYSPGEVIHVTQVKGGVPTIVRGDAQVGAPITFTVRLSNREAGIDDNNVYLQIKDPDSRYQDANNLEHKVFTRDSTDFNATRSADPDSGSETSNLYNGGYGNYFQFFSVPVTGQPNANYNLELRGVSGGFDGTAPIGIGRVDPTTPPGTNPVTYQYGKDNAGNALRTRLAGPDPANFTVPGQEYECQFLHPDFDTFGTTQGTGDAVAEDYGRPYYLAGVDDQQTHSGGAHLPRIAPNTVAAAGPPQTYGHGGNEWLHLTRAPAAQQDGQGGVLYTMTWTPPTSVSDFYLDVIAYDQARTPANPTTGASSFPDTSGSVDTSGNPVAAGTPAPGSNWRIYDNVWGFSTQPFTTPNNILVVNDNALGQKFYGNNLGGGNQSNIPNTFYGTESYFTDIDVNLLPNAIFRYVTLTGPQKPDGTSDGPDGRPEAQVLAISRNGEYNGFSPSRFLTNPSTTLLPVFNGLGVNSYNATQQAYTQWRILSRGAVPQSVLNKYLPGSFESQPAVNDPEAQIQAPAATVPVANRCVLWFAPYAGLHPLNVTGSIEDVNTQATLRSYVNAGGRLFLSGANVASTLSQGGLNPSQNAPGSFLVDVLNATYVTGVNQTPGNVLGGAAGRIAGDAAFNGNNQNFSTQSTGTGEGNYTYASPASLPLILGNNYASQNPPDLNDWRTDGSLSQLGPNAFLVSPTPGIFNTVHSLIGVVQPQNGAATDLTLAGNSALVYRANINANGARVIFGSIGLEGIGIEYYKVAAVNPNITAAPNNDAYFARNQRPNILHNIVTYLRTGTATGIISGTNPATGTTAPLAGATVYLTPAAPGATHLFSGTTNASGVYTINGIDPGNYVVHAYKTGYRSNASLGSEGVTANSTSSLNLPLTALSTGTLSGKVVDQNGVALQGVLLTFKTLDGTSTVTGTSQADGTYTIPNVTAGAYNGTATKAKFTPAIPTSGNPFPGPDGTVPDATGNPPNVRAGQQTSNVNFRILPIPGTLAGLVKDFTAPNAPVPGATITITDTAGNPVNDFQGNPVTPLKTTATTISPAAPNGDGSPVNYGTASLVEGSYNVTITPPAGFGNPQPSATVTVAITSAGFTRQDFTLTSTQGTLAGLVTDADTTQPLGGATVTITDDATQTTVATLTTDPSGAVTTPPNDGRFGDGGAVNYSQLLTGGATYTITVTAPNHLPKTAKNVPITANQFKRQDFVLPTSLGTIGGLVSDSFTPTQSLVGATVTITDPAGNPVNDPNGNPIGPFTIGAATPNSPTGGRFGDGQPVNYSQLIEHGTYKVTASATDHTTLTTLVTVQPATFARVDFPLVSTLGTVGGLVTDSFTKQPLPNATVVITDPAGNTVYQVTTDANGGPQTSATDTRYGDGGLVNYVKTLTVGITYTVTASAANYTTQTFSVTLTPNVFVRHDFPLVSTLGTVGGLVTDSFTKTPLPNATVAITDPAGNTVYKVTTDAQGGPTTSSADTRYGDNKPVNYAKTLTVGIKYTVTASAANYTTQTFSVTLTPDTFVRHDFPLVSTLGTVGGLVTDPSTNQPLAGATVTITDVNGTTVYTTTTTATPAASPTDTRFGDGGTVSYIATLTVGNYTVTVSKIDPNSPNTTAQNFLPISFPVTITSNTFVRKDVALVNANGTLGGLVTDSFTHQPIAGASVTILDAAGNTVKSLTTRAVPISPAAPTGDGSPINFSATLLQDTYSVTVSAPDHTTIGPVKVSVTGSQFIRQDFALVSTLGTLGGLVTDSYSGQPLPGVTVTVKDSANNTAATYTTSATLTSPTAPSGDGKPLNYSGILTQGTYTVTISRRGFATAPAQSVTVTPNAFVRLDFTGAAGLPPQHVFPAGLNFLSFPYDYAGASVTFDALFGALNPAPISNPGAGGNRSHVYVWQPQMVQYVADPTPPADAPRLGQGYWVYLIKPSETTVPGNPATGSSVVMPLSRGWNMIGVPNLSAIGVSALTFNNLASGGTLTFDQAVSSTFKLVSPTLYGFDGTNYVPVTAGGALQPYQSYWIYVYANTSVNLPTGQ